MKQLLVLALASCASSGPAMEMTKIETLDYAVPVGWKLRDLSTLQNVAHEWTPEDNPRKESLVVSRVEQPALARSHPHLKRTLVRAANELPSARFTSPTSFVTCSGLGGVRVEGSFMPRGPAVPYHRIHAVLVDGSSLVHVLYTARDPDREHFEAVLDGFRNGD